MKKALSFVICAVLILSLAVVGYADFDLSGMSYDELVALKDQINLAIWNSAEWQEVEVPQGVWAVGSDIPAGKWEIKALPGAETYIVYGTEVKNGGTDVSSKSHEHVIDPGYTKYEADKDVTSWVIDLDAGSYVQIKYGTAVFMPYSGKPALGFK